MNIEIRNLRKDELAAAAKIFVEAFNNVGEMWTYETALGRLESSYKPEYYFGAFIKGVMVAMMATKLDYVTDHKELYIDIFAVTPTEQNKHIGKLFLEKIEQFAKDKMLKTVWLQTSTKLPSYNFYLKNGYNTSNWVAIYKDVKFTE